MTDDIGKLLDEREATYGDFVDVADAAQTIKSVRRAPLPKPQAEAFDMIATKLARIACGNPWHVDTWMDIAGYATLVVNYLEGVKDAGEENSLD